MILKTFQPEIKSINEDARTIEHVISTETPDRDGDIIEAAGWNLTDFEKNPVVLFGHRHDEPPIGRAVRVKTSERGLEAVTQFPPKGVHHMADVVFDLNRLGYLRSWSVGFIPTEWAPIENGMGRRYTKQTLIEYSSVPLPANAEAMNLAVSKGLVNARDVEALGWTKAPTPSVEKAEGAPLGAAESFSDEKLKLIFETELYRFSHSLRNSTGRGQKKNR